MQQATLNFFDKVYGVAKLIPYGRVTSYGAIAKYLGAARSSRMVGYAMNASHNMEGKHHFEGTNLMQQLLESEGVVVIENQIQDFDVLFWDPSKELQH